MFIHNLYFVLAFIFTKEQTDEILKRVNAKKISFVFLTMSSSNK